jgi:hypothetical protein
MAIKEVITLEGAEEVKSQLASINKAGEDSLKQFRDLGSASGAAADPFGKLVDSAKNAGLEFQNTGRHTNTLREALHALHPILQVAGVRMGELGSFARLAGASLPALAAAAGGAIVIALATLEETAKRTQGRLQDLFGGSTTAGAQAFKALETSAKGLGTTVETLAPGFEALKTAVDRFAQSTQGFKFVALRPEDLPTGSAQNIKTLTDAYENFIKVLRAGRLDQENAGKAAKVFFDALKEGGKLTGDILKQLPVGTIGLLADALGKGRISAEAFIAEANLAPIPINKLVEALARFGPQAQTAFDTSAIKTFGDSFGKLVNSLQEGFKTISGTTFSDAAVGFLDKVTQSIKATKDEIQLFIDTWQAFKNLFPDLPKIIGTTETVPLPQPRPIQAPPKGFIVPPPDTKQISEAIDQIDQEVTPKVDELGQRWGEALFGKGLHDKLLEVDAAVAGAFADTPIDMTTPEQSFQEGMNQIVASAQAAFDKILAIFAQPIKVNFDTSGASGFTAPGGAPFAGGGQVRGPGSSTSDSIMAWLSDFEYVINARAVRHYGADLFGALNAMALPKDFMNRFAMGGLARSAGNRLASGGQVSSGNSVTLKIDRHTFNMTAGDDTVAAIKRFAVAAQISSTGRKPRFVR